MKDTKQKRHDHAQVKSTNGAPCVRKRAIPHYNEGYERSLTQQQNDIFRSLRRDWIDCPREEL